MSTISTNVFVPVDVKGDVKNKAYGNRYNAKVYHSSVNTLVPGTAVKCVDVAGGVIVVDTAAEGDDIFGFVQYEAAKSNSYVADDKLSIASMGSIIMLEASASIALGATLQYVASGEKVVTATTGTKIGKALRKASSGNLFPVLVLVPSLVQSFTDLNDAPSALVASKAVTVNSGGTALELTDIPTT